MENKKYSSVETIIRHIMALKSQPKTDEEEQLDSMKRTIAKKVNEFSRKQTKTDTDEGVDMLKDIPKGLASTVRSLIEKDRAAFLEQKKEQDARIAEIREAMKSHTVPKTAKDKSLAALAHPKDKITHADVMVGRGVKKEEVENVEEADNLALRKLHTANPQSIPNYMRSTEKGKKSLADKNRPVLKDLIKTQLGRHPKANLPEEAENIEEAGKVVPGSAFSKDYKPQGDKPGEKAGFTSKKISTGMVYSRKPVKEATDTPGNSAHQCAIHVKSEQFGEGKTLFSQHALPDANGEIAWYDVMFEHGIEKRVPTSELQILVSESHMNHKKSKSSKSEESMDDEDDRNEKSE